MSEDEAIACLTQTRPPIRRGGVLTRDEVAAAVTAYLKNALDLFEEALLLRAHEKVPRAAALTVLGLEELAKIPMLVNTFLRFERGVDQQAWTAYWKSGGSHRTKQELILSYGQIIRALFEGEPVHSRKLYRYYAPETVLQNLDSFKQSNFYVDLRDDGVHAPGVGQGNVHALGYLLAFGQERADSFCSWHVSARRSADYLDMARHPNPSSRWTSHYALQEVRADILYQAASLSASAIPDYTTFYDFAETYKGKVSEKHFKEALLSLANLMRSRVEQSKALPVFYDRYLNAFKLMIGLSDQKQVVGASFGRKLRQALLDADPGN